ncbi:MAG: condensation domain-containing protein, partial [Psychrosphaera sp.]|nr:condensation domain-containing protein [Psychrosphaera sp.]
IGRPLAKATLYVLDDHAQLLPNGSCGELYIGGPGVAQGYINQPELTASVFIDNPFAQGIIYKTGDLVRHLPNGNLEFVGRVDSQVKIRGYRIELGEIEHQLLQHQDVESAVVLAQDTPTGKQLIAYVKGGADISALKQHLGLTLPEYMVPSAFMSMNKWPLSANGKLNKKALPMPDTAQLVGAFVEPATTTELALANIFANLLKIDNISASAHFFESGGHSLLSVRLVSEVRALLNVELAIRDIFDCPVLADLATLIDSQSGKAIRSNVVALKRTSNQLPASFAQARLWFIDQMDGASSQYNMPGSFRFSGLLEAKTVEQAFVRIIERHESLRTVFVNSNDGVQQLIGDGKAFKLTVIDLTGLGVDAQDRALQQFAASDAAKPFDLACDLMLRCSFVRLAANQGALLFNMHHIASDGWSMGLLVSEFWRQVAAISADKPNPFAPLPIQYADYALWQKSYLEGDVLDGQLDYWTTQLAGLPAVHELPLDRERPKEQGFAGDRVTVKAGQDTLKGLQQLALANNATLFMVLHGAFSQLLSRHSNSEDIIVGVPMANRLQKELESVIGFFINTLVLRADCSNNPTFTDFLTDIRQVNLDAQANQDVPFEHLVERLQPLRSTAYSPLFQIMFTMNTTETSDFALADLTLSPLTDTEAEMVAKFELTLNAMVSEDGLLLSFDYNTDLFDRATIKALGERLVNLLQSIVANPGQN